jgi:hypothetical protein
MAKKTALIGVLILALAAAGAAAHERGDLMLNIEPQLGTAFPDLGWFLDGGMLPGIDFGLRTTANYYFTKAFSVNAGIGYAGNYHVFLAEEGKYKPIVGFNNLFDLIFLWPFIGFINYIGFIPQAVGNQLTAEHDVFFASYFTIPFGFNYAFKKVALGAGLIGNIPVHGFGVYRAPYTQTGGFNDPNVTFGLKPHLGWYVDIGGTFKKFGMALRLSGAFEREIVKSPEWLRKTSDPYSFNFFSMSLVFKFGIPLAKLPIKSRKEQATEEN